MVFHHKSICGVRLLTKRKKRKKTRGVHCGLKIRGFSNFSTVFLQSVFMKILNLLQFQTIGLIQAIQLLTSQT